MIRLYCDGGVILKNPSPIGGTWAWCITHEDDTLVDHGCGVILPTDTITFSDDGTVSNNQTELFAILQGLSKFKDTDIAHIYSDSNISLGRIFKNFTMHNIPSWMVTSLKMEQKRLIHWKLFKHTLLDGHPTKAHLLRGIGKRGHPVSKWNKLCDDLCNASADEYVKSDPRILSMFRES